MVPDRLNSEHFSFVLVQASSGLPFDIRCPSLMKCTKSAVRWKAHLTPTYVSVQAALLLFSRVEKIHEFEDCFVTLTQKIGTDSGKFNFRMEPRNETNHCRVLLFIYTGGAAAKISSETLIASFKVLKFRFEIGARGFDRVRIIRKSGKKGFISEIRSPNCTVVAFESVARIDKQK